MGKIIGIFVIILNIILVSAIFTAVPEGIGRYILLIGLFSLDILAIVKLFTGDN